MKNLVFLLVWKNRRRFPCAFSYSGNNRSGAGRTVIKISIFSSFGMFQKIVDISADGNWARGLNGKTAKRQDG